MNIALEQFLIMRAAAYDSYAAAALSMSLHPGSTRDQAHPRSAEQIAAIADAMLVERDKRFPIPLKLPEQK